MTLVNTAYLDNGKIKSRVIHQKWLVTFFTVCNRCFVNADQSPVGLFRGSGLRSSNGLGHGGMFLDWPLLLASLNTAREHSEEGFL